MKFSIRVIAFTFVVAAAVAGNSLPSSSSRAAVHSSAMPASTPIPMCNPFTNPCPNIREK